MRRWLRYVIAAVGSAIIGALIAFLAYGSNTLPRVSSAPAVSSPGPSTDATASTTGTVRR